MSFQITKRFLMPSSKIKHYRDAHKRCLSVSCSKRNFYNNILCSPIEVQIPNVSLTEYVFEKTAPFADYTAFVSILKYNYTYIRYIFFSKT